MRLLALLFLLFIAPSLCRADDWLTHDAAHFGAGVAIGACTNAFCHWTGVEKDHPLASAGLTVLAATFAGAAKEVEDQRGGGVFDWGQFFSTVAGGVVAVQLRF